MKLEFTKVKESQATEECWMVDCKDCPGSPPVGYGKTKEAALAALFYSLIFSNAGGYRDAHNWLCYIKADEPIIIDGEIWKNPIKIKR